MTYRILTTMQRARLKSAMRDIDRSRRVVRAFAVLCVLAVAVLLLVSCADARCVKFHCPTGHDYETRNETLNP